MTGLRSKQALAVKTVLPLAAVASLFFGLQRFGGSRWPLQGANMQLVAAAVGFFVLANILRARSWQRLFPANERPSSLTLLSGVGASGAAAPFLPARLDLPVKMTVINRLQPNIRFSTVGISLISLGLAEFASMFVASAIAALSAQSGSMQIIAALLALANLLACLLLVKEQAVIGFLGRFSGERMQRISSSLSERLAETAEAKAAVVGFAGCWLLRAAGTWALMGALGLPGLTHLVFVYLALGAISCALPISPGGAAMSIGAGTAILLGCGVSGTLATSYATSSAVIAFIAALATLLVALLAAIAQALRPRLALLRLRLATQLS